ncbi:hypothetical protein DPX16_22243 [Anabarilius grahami]|uniref:Uncharacterized protein n=1 Tax=Anabarilius grahami TaxID=495550 RepID=A0A3N0XP31_ANAGA|nr:hypothetical protein DPX16_22243 [Anabarilius grahami]
MDNVSWSDQLDVLSAVSKTGYASLLELQNATHMLTDALASRHIYQSTMCRTAAARAPAYQHNPQRGAFTCHHRRCLCLELSVRLILELSRADGVNERRMRASGGARDQRERDLPVICFRFKMAHTARRHDTVTSFNQARLAPGTSSLR